MLRALRLPVIVVVGALFAVSGCGGPTGSVSAEEAPAPERRELTAADVRAHRAAWEDVGVDDYSYVIESSCGCDWDGIFRVTVRNDEVVSTRPVGGGERFREYFGQTIDGLFDSFAEAILVEAEEDVAGAGAAAAFDPGGWPSAFQVRWGGQGPGWEATVRSFAAGDEPLPPQPAATTFLMVSNQSFEEPEVDVTITEGTRVLVDTRLEVRNQHHFVSYALPLDPGRHELTVTAGSGAATEHVLEVPDDASVHVSVTYWSGESPSDRPYFSVQESDQPFGIA